MTEPIQPARIDPDAIYDDGALVLGLGLSSSVLVKARRNGRLRFTRKGRRVLYRGEWVLAWIEESDAAQGVRHE